MNIRPNPHREELLRRQLARSATAAAHNTQIADLAATAATHDRQIASLIRALDKQRGIVTAIGTRVVTRGEQIEELGDRIDQFLNRLGPQ